MPLLRRLLRPQPARLARQRLLAEPLEARLARQRLARAALALGLVEPQLHLAPVLLRLHLVLQALLPHPLAVERLVRRPQPQRQLPLAALVARLHRQRAAAASLAQPPRLLLLAERLVALVARPLRQRLAQPPARQRLVLRPPLHCLAALPLAARAAAAACLEEQQRLQRRRAPASLVQPPRLAASLVLPPPPPLVPQELLLLPPHLPTPLVLPH